MFTIHFRKFRQNATDIEARSNNKVNKKWAEKTVRGSGDGKSVNDMSTEETKKTMVSTDHMNRNTELHGNTDFSDFNKSVDF